MEIISWQEIERVLTNLFCFLDEMTGSVLRVSEEWWRTEEQF